MPIFRVKSVKIYTSQKNLHGYIRGIRDKYQVCPPADRTRSIWHYFIYITATSGQKRAVRSKGGRRVQRERQHQQQPGCTQLLTHIHINTITQMHINTNFRTYKSHTHTHIYISTLTHICTYSHMYFF